MGVEDINARFDKMQAAQLEMAEEIRASRKSGYGYKALDFLERQRTAVVGKNGKFDSFGDFANCVRMAGNNPQRVEKMARYCKALPSGMNESVGADGAYLVPPQFVNELLMRTYDNDLLSRCTMVPTTSQKITIPAVNETSRANGSRFGGVQAYWADEADTISATKPSLKTVDLMPHKLTGMVRVTDELLNDASALEQFIGLMMAQEFQFKIGDAIVNGNGVKKPTGLLNSAALVTVAKETGQGAATIQTENVLKMWARLHASCRANAVWLINQDAEVQLPLMTVGVAGAQLAVYIPQNGLSGLPYATLLGRPVIPVEFCKTLGTVGDIILFDPSQYLVASLGGLQQAVSMHLYFDTAEQAFRYIMRIDGKLWWLSALTPYQGSNTQSCVVALAARA